EWQGPHATVDRIARRSLESDTSSGSNSAVECDLAKVEVAGSNPVSRSKVSRRRRHLEAGKFERCLRLLVLQPFGRRSQVVRQRSAKPLSIGSIPIAASFQFNNLLAVPLT